MRYFYYESELKGGQKILFEVWTRKHNFLLCFLLDLGIFIFGGLGGNTWALPFFSPSFTSNQILSVYMYKTPF